MSHGISWSVAVILIISGLASCTSEKIFKVRLADEPSEVIGNAVEYAVAHHRRPVTVVFSKGVHRISEPIRLEGIDHPFSLKGEDGAVLSGELPIKDWTPSNIGEGVWQADLKACGITDFGEVFGQKNRVDLYYLGKRQHISRYPNDDFMLSGKALGATEMPPNWTGIHAAYEGIIEYLDDRIGSWAEEDDPLFFGYWHWDWYDEILVPDKIDTESKIITFKDPQSHYGYKDGLRFYGLNLLCELDVPGEYYIDRQNGIIYFCAPEDFDGSGTTLSVYGEDYLIYAADCNKLTIGNLEMSGARGGAISVSGGKDNVVDACKFVRFGNAAISFAGGTGHIVQGCFLSELGHGGITATGGDRVTLEPSGFVFRDNIVQDFSLFRKTYQPAIFFEGVGAKVEHNLFQRAPSSALNFRGNDIDIEYNQFFDLVRESDDQGGFDTWGDYTYKRFCFRHNHWRNIRGGIYAGAAAIRFDDMISGHIIDGDVFEECGDSGFGGVQIHGGKDNLVQNCVFYDCPYMVSSTPWTVEKWYEFYNEHKDGRELYDSALYKERYPELKDSFDSHLNVNYVRNNILVGGESVLRNGEQYVCSNNTLIPELERPLDYWLKDEVLAEYGIAPVPFSEIGPRGNKYAE